MGCAEDLKSELNGSGESASPDLPSPTSADDSAHERTTQEHHARTPKLTAEEIVASKVAQFGQKRRGLVRAIAQRTQREIPPELEKFLIETRDPEANRMPESETEVANFLALLGP